MEGRKLINCDSFGKSTRMIRIDLLEDGEFVGDELERDDGQESGQDAVGGDGDGDVDDAFP